MSIWVYIPDGRVETCRVDDRATHPTWTYVPELERFVYTGPVAVIDKRDAAVAKGRA